MNANTRAVSLPPERDYVAYDPDTPALGMNLHILDPDEWIEVDERLPQDLAEKRRLLRERHDEVMFTSPAGDDGARETLTLLAEHLPARYPQAYVRQGDRLYNRATDEEWDLSALDLHPLEMASRLVQEDFCLMGQAEPDGDYRLIAACVCFPTRWNLAEKAGRSLNTIHDPVPGYDGALASPMTRLFDRLKPERPVWRMNWSVLDDPALFQPSDHGRIASATDITPANASERLWLRMERQTLRRLPASGDVLFTIRIYVRPLSSLAKRPERAAQLAHALGTISPGMATYKGLPAIREAAVAWLLNVAG